MSRLTMFKERKGCRLGEDGREEVKHKTGDGSSGDVSSFNKINAGKRPKPNGIYATKRMYCGDRLEGRNL